MHFHLSFHIVSDSSKTRYWPVILPSARFHLTIWDKNALRALEAGTRFTFPDSRKFARLLAAWPHFQQIWTESKLLCKLIVSRPVQQKKNSRSCPNPIRIRMFKKTRFPNTPCLTLPVRGLTARVLLKAVLFTELRKKCTFIKLQGIYYCMGMEALHSKPQVSSLYPSTQHFRLVWELRRTPHPASRRVQLLYGKTQGP